jgi:dTDP-4-amino-4,6-dideoxygalactose transaminase
MIPFSKPFSTPAEMANVEQALASGHVSGDGPFTARASTMLSQHLGGADVLLTTSCTHALELAALVLGIGPEDEVVMPSYTFVSTANAFALRGARIRFADVDPGTFSMGVRELEAALTPQTTTVVAMHYGGVTRDVDAMRDLCARRSLKFVEDNAHGLFGSFRGRPLGTFASLSAVSFHATKNVSCGEGGALVLNESSLRRQAEILREKGTDRSRFLRGEVDKYTWRAVGSSYLPSDILAAVLCAQLENSSSTQARRQGAWCLYRELLEPRADDLGLRLQEVPAGCDQPAHVLAVILPPGLVRSSILASLAAAGVKATSHYEPLHLADAHRGKERLPVTERLGTSLIRLPLFAALSEDDVARVVTTFLDVVRSSRSAA